MKAKYVSYFILLFLISFSFTANAENLYILFDENCMDKLEYDQPQKGDYMVYRVNTGGGESVILEAGTESKIGQDALPRPFIGCYNGSFDMLLVNRINARPDEVYLVVPKGKKYYITPIISAAHYKNMDDVITYVSPKYSFKFDLKNGVINENISYKDIRAKVYFDGRLDNDCSGIYLFRQTSRNSSGAYVSLKFVPEIGIVEETLNVSPRNTGEVALSLDKINDKKYEKYLESLCAKATEETITFDPSYKPDAYNVTPVQPTPNTPNMVRKNTPTEFVQKGGEPTVASFHIVKKGETLYGIAKKYDITVGDLKSWNDKKGNVIRSGEKYIVSAPQEEAPQVMDETLTAKGGLAWETGKQTSSTAAWDRNTEGTHIVKSGETIASIAMKYGYTEARFRQMNNLSKNDYAKVGQPLSTTDCNCPNTTNTLTAKTVEGYPVMNNTGSMLPFVDDPAEPTRTLEASPYDTRVSSPVSYDTRVSSPVAYEAKPYDPFTATSVSRSTTAAPAPTNRAVQHYDTPVNTGSYYQNQTSNYGQPRNYQAPVTYPKTEADPDFVPDEFTVKGINPARTVPAEFNAKNPKRIMHTVQEGDNLFRIARQYGVTVEHLRSINNLELNEIIIPYQKIYIH